MIEAREEAVENNHFKAIFKVISFIITMIAIIFICYALKLEVFEDRVHFINYIKKLGLIAPIIFIILQILQVIIPIIPGGVSCMVGVLAFGPILGFIYNYIGLVIGSIVVYYLSRKYGVVLIKKLFKEETINKYLNKINNNFKKIFLITIILPWFPDDLLCYIAGISNITFKSYILIILFCRSISLLFYSIFINIL